MQQRVISFGVEYDRQSQAGRSSFNAVSTLVIIRLSVARRVRWKDRIASKKENLSGCVTIVKVNQK